MFKKLGISLLTATISIFSATAYCAAYEYEFIPNVPQVFTNYSFWDLGFTCRMTTEDESDELMAEAKAKKGSINGIPLKAGETLRMQIHSGDVLKLKADSAAVVHITNLGAHTVKATCELN